MTTDQRRKPDRPPYAPVKGVREFFERVRSKEPPGVINKEYLATLAVAAGNEQHVIGTLKWLQLIDRDGRPTSDYKVLYYKGPDRRHGLQNLLRRAYPSLFSDKLVLQTATRSDVHDHFVQHHGLHGQIARKAAALFALLCDLAELNVSADLLQGRERAPEQQRVKRVQGVKGPANDGEARTPTAGAVRDSNIASGQWQISVTLRPEMSEDEIVAFLTRVKRAVARVEGG